MQKKRRISAGVVSILYLNDMPSAVILCLYVGLFFLTLHTTVCFCHFLKESWFIFFSHDNQLHCNELDPLA